MTEEIKETKKRKPLGLNLGAVPSADLTKDSKSSIRQSLSHGRSKTVTVEVKRKRMASEVPASPEASSKLTHQEQTMRFKAVQEALQQSMDNQREAERKREQELFQEQSPAVREELPIEPLELVSEAAPKKFHRPAEAGPSKRFQEEGEESRKRPAKGVVAKKRGGQKAAIEEAPITEEEPTRVLGPILGLKKLRKGGAKKKPIMTSTKRPIEISEALTVQELAAKMSEKVGILIKTLLKMGMTATVNQLIDVDTAELVAQELGYPVERVVSQDPEEVLWNEQGAEEDMVARPPVVTVMGHVDHGKTSLLDALRKTDVVAKEAGGITQHIGAYQVQMPSGKKLTFIDTPGHEAFTHMRARGAHVTDIVVLVVAADDRVNAQTVEAIHHAQSAGAPMIVAINKIDKHNANPGAIRQQLLSEGIVVETLGGNVLDVEVSALTHKNLDQLEEAILLQADMMHLAACPRIAGRGVIIETHIKKGYGSVGTVLVQDGTLKKGDVFVCGNTWGRVRLMFDDKGKPVKEAGPSLPIEVCGFQDLPRSGDRFIAVSEEAVAKEILQWKSTHQPAAEVLPPAFSLVDRLKSVKELALILKADVQGSLEGLVHELSKIQHPEVSLKIIHKGVGAVNESDVLLAKASQAIILAFNVSLLPQAKQLVERGEAVVFSHNVIYHAVDEVKKALSGLLTPEYHEEILGRAEVLQVFSTKKGAIAGCVVKEGILRRNERMQILRGNTVIYEGNIRSLRHLKDDVREIKSGQECGVTTGFEDYQPHDVIVCLKIKEQARSIT